MSWGQKACHVNNEETIGVYLRQKFGTYIDWTPFEKMTWEDINEFNHTYKFFTSDEMEAYQRTISERIDMA